MNPTIKKKSKILVLASANGSKPATPHPDEIASVRQLKRSVAALRRLDISQDDLDAAPQITPLLKNAQGGLKQVISAMRLSPDEVIVAFLLKYDSIPIGDRERLPIEAVALAAGVDINHLLGSIMLALQTQAVNTVKIIAMTAHPAITRARVKYGQMAGGDKDRTALDTAMGFLPSPKAPTFIGKAIFGSGRSVMDQQSGDNDEDEEPPIAAAESDPDLDKLFPPANLMQEKLAAIRQRSRELPGSTSVFGRH
jgi:hypothetical protein